jgi:hypothetical protein
VPNRAVYCKSFDSGLFITTWGKSTINLMKNETLIMLCVLQKSLRTLLNKKYDNIKKGDKAPDFQD